MKKPKTWLYHVLKPILHVVIFIMYKPKFVHKEYIPAIGPVITAGNHQRLVMDSMMIGLATPRSLRYLAKKEHFTGFKKFFYGNVGCVPVNRGNSDNNAKAMMIKLLNEGNIVNIFPEGTRNRFGDELLLPFRKGVAVFANQTNATIVPFAITSSWKIFKYDTIVEFGKPFKGSGNVEKDTARLKKAVADILIKNKE